MPLAYHPRQQLRVLRDTRLAIDCLLLYPDGVVAAAQERRHLFVRQPPAKRKSDLTLCPGQYHSVLLITCSSLLYVERYLQAATQLANTLVGHRLDSPLQELDEQRLTDEGDDTADAHQLVDFTTHRVKTVDLDAEIAVDPACCETFFLHFSFILGKNNSFEVLREPRKILIFVPLTPQN